MFIRKAGKENSPLCLQIFSTRGLVLKKVWPLRRWGSETQIKTLDLSTGLIRWPI